MPTKTRRSVVIGTIILVAILFLVDRYYWAQIPPWREDASTNLWLGYTRGIGHLSVGLISSRKLPNPNGMPLLGVFLSALPNLLTISFFSGPYANNTNCACGLESIQQELAKWYPASMTQGRSFDYGLLRRYGLSNQQEGIQPRMFGSGRYLVTYAFEDPPSIENANITNYIFGRLQVSVDK